MSEETIQQLQDRWEKQAAEMQLTAPERFRQQAATGRMCRCGECYCCAALRVDRRQREEGRRRE